MTLCVALWPAQQDLDHGGVLRRHEGQLSSHVCLDWFEPRQKAAQSQGCLQALRLDRRGDKRGLGNAKAPMPLPSIPLKFGCRGATADSLVAVKLSTRYGSADGMLRQELTFLHSGERGWLTEAPPQSPNCSPNA
jgi:hypothetical protein